jgi:hypothetical protein
VTWWLGEEEAALDWAAAGRFADVPPGEYWADIELRSELARLLISTDFPVAGAALAQKLAERQASRDLTDRAAALPGNTSPGDRGALRGNPWAARWIWQFIPVFPGGFRNPSGGRLGGIGVMLGEQYQQASWATAGRNHRKPSLHPLGEQPVSIACVARGQGGMELGPVWEAHCSTTICAARTLTLMLAR